MSVQNLKTGEKSAIYAEKDDTTMLRDDKTML
jgi:hypothetical protein